jgi:hypothetical protein
MEPKSSLPCLQDPATFSFRELVQKQERQKQNPKISKVNQRKLQKVRSGQEATLLQWESLKAA